MIAHIRHYLTALLLCVVASGAMAQSLSDEQAKLAKLERQNQNLAALNTDIETSINALDTEIETLEAQNPQQDALAKTAAALAAAQAESDNNPSQINTDKLEMAQFKHALAIRKQAKSNPALASLKKEKSELEKAVSSNTQKINNNRQLIASQKTLIAKLEDQQESARQAWLLKQEQQKSSADADRLRKAEAERQSALAEVERLRAMLAQQQNEQEAAKRQQLQAAQAQEAKQAQAVAAATPQVTETNIPSSAQASEFESFVFLASNKEIAAEKARIETALRAKNVKETKFSKFI